MTPGEPRQPGRSNRPQNHDVSILMIVTAGSASLMWLAAVSFFADAVYPAIVLSLILFAMLAYKHHKNN